MPFFIVWIILAGVVVCLGAAVLMTRRPGMSLSDTLGVKASTFLAIIFFGSGVFVGFLVTHYSSPTPATWWEALAVRVAWQFGSGVWLALAVVGEVRGAGRLGGRVWALAMSFLAIGAFLSLHPFLDLIEGPAHWQGAASLDIERSHSTSGSGHISATLRVKAANGSVEQLELTGWSANVAQDKLAGYRSKRDLRVTVLRHIAKVIDIRASDAPPQ